MPKLNDSLTTVTLSDETYAALMLKVAEFYEALSDDYTVLTSNFVSDRFSKKAYYFAVLKRTRDFCEATGSVE